MTVEINYEQINLCEIKTSRKRRIKNMKMLKESIEEKF